MNRRNFIKSIGASSVFSTLPLSFKLHAAPEDYAGKFLITIQAEGGWDVTSFCDPKVNVPGERDINNWSQTGEIQTIGNLSYAPFADNANFFQKYYQDMLVINGVDAQTNSHSAGVVHNWSGRISEGYPSLTSLFAAQNGASLPIAYINNGGYFETGGLARYTRLDNPGPLVNAIYPNRNIEGGENYMHNSDFAHITSARNSRLQSVLGGDNRTARQIQNQTNFRSAIDNANILSDFATAIRSAGGLQAPVQSGDFYSTLRRQAQLALIAMNSGVSVAADLVHWGFDTHQNHDTQHTWLLTELAGGIDYLWTYAESLGIADRLVVVIASDFGRTPHYNETQGKDHWPVGSVVVMEKNQSYTNRVVGLTDGGHNVIPISASSHVADQSGEIIHPIHVMSELRSYLGVDQIALDNGFSLNPSVNFGIFSG